MKERLRKKWKRGITLVEVLIASTVLAIAMLSLARGYMILSRQTISTKHRAFASQKAIQMMEELRGLISDTGNSNIGVLDDYDDGATYSQILTTKREVTDPGDPVSNNSSQNFKRQISVMALPNEPLARRVYVRVFDNDSGQALAETVSIIRTINNRFYPTQVYDVYILCLENVPGWWISPSTMKPMFDNVIGDLQTRNPGMEWRLHWVTRLSYGRDPHYTPYINRAVETNLASPTDVYFYPGLMDQPSVGDFEYYVASSINGRINVDGTVENPASYTMADQYNHAVRYPDEVEMYDQAVAAAETSGEATPEISLRMLYEMMNSSSAAVSNLMIINLHGELVPLPPIRNYSDPAKDPVNFTNQRAVVHPEQLSYNSGSQVNLRTYAYVTNPGSVADGTLLSTMTVIVNNTQLTSGNISVRRMIGSSTYTYSWQNATLNSDYTLTLINSTQTLITLYRTPLRHPRHAASNTGLDSGEWVYGYEYIPCLVSSNTTFQDGVRDLQWPSSTQPKNTARWVIRIAAGVLANGQYSIETRMGNDYTTGMTGNEPTNVSKTYVWVGQTPPVTEQYQFMGDPRHMPYSDVMVNHGYNWYFRDISSTDYPRITNDADGWNGALNVDIPRFFQLLRHGLLISNGIWNSMTGFSFYYVGLGGEMGYDASNGFPSGLPIIETPWNAGGSSIDGIDEITNAQDRPFVRLISNTANTWWGAHWLGELYPDSTYAGTWSVDGNLPVGSGNYYRATYTSKGFAYDPQKRTNQQGCASFYNGNTGTANTYFQHEYWDSTTADITATGSRLDQDFNFPLLTTLTAGRPFRLNSGSGAPPEWNNAVYSGIRTTLSTMESYYDTTGNTATHDSLALVAITSSTNVGRMVMNGLSPQSAFGSSQISKLCTINLLRGFLASGQTSITNSRIPQVPRVSISSPSATDEFINPSNITVFSSTTWRRWDANAYTENYAANFTEAISLITNIKYSPDNGQTWYMASDSSPAESGVVNASYNAGNPFTWNVSSLARGNYLLRVEVYRGNRALHYAYHQVQIYIQR